MMPTRTELNAAKMAAALRMFLGFALLVVGLAAAVYGLIFNGAYGPYLFIGGFIAAVVGVWRLDVESRPGP